MDNNYDNRTLKVIILGEEGGGGDVEEGAQIWTKPRQWALDVVKAQSGGRQV